VEWFWLAQIDIVSGIWATPWAKDFDDSVCIGAIQVILYGLINLTNNRLIRYVPHPATAQYHDWAALRGLAFPAYAINARNGVVAAGPYGQVTVSAFKQKVPHSSFITRMIIRLVATGSKRTGPKMRPPS
jgi:hypothetical protein